MYFFFFLMKLIIFYNNNCSYYCFEVLGNSKFQYEHVFDFLIHLSKKNCDIFIKHQVRLKKKTLNPGFFYTTHGFFQKTRVGWVLGNSKFQYEHVFDFLIHLSKKNCDIFIKHLVRFKKIKPGFFLYNPWFFSKNPGGLGFFLKKKLFFNPVHYRFH